LAASYGASRGTVNRAWLGGRAKLEALPRHRSPAAAKEGGAQLRHDLRTGSERRSGAGTAAGPRGRSGVSVAAGARIPSRAERRGPWKRIRHAEPRDTEAICELLWWSCRVLELRLAQRRPCADAAREPARALRLGRRNGPPGHRDRAGYACSRPDSLPCGASRTPDTLGRCQACSADPRR